MADQVNRLMQQQLMEYGYPFLERPSAKGTPSDWEIYNAPMDRMAGMRMGLQHMRDFGMGNPIGAIPGAFGFASDIYGLFDPAYQQRTTDSTRRFLQQRQIRDNAGDAQNQPGGFYGPSNALMRR